MSYLQQDSYFTKENISQRIVKRSAELWGYDEAQIDQFDPLVKLLIEGCSVEFEKIGQEIKGTELRLMTRLAEILCPEIQRNPQPAMAIAQTRSLEAKGWIDPENQLVAKRTNVRKGESPDLFFSSIGKFPIVNAGMVCYATPVGLYTMEKGTRSLLAPAVQGNGGEQQIFLGLEIDPAVTSWEGFRFFVDWPGDVSQGVYTDFLSLARWESDLGDVRTDLGLKVDRDADDLTLVGWDKNFVNLAGADGWERGKFPLKMYPEEFEGMFDKRTLQTLKKPLAWIKITWPAAFPSQGFENIKISLNAFPIWNKQLHKLTYRLQTGMNGIALPSGEAFIGINTVVNQKGESYTASDKNILYTEDALQRKYTLRQQGVGRMDKRNAKAFLYQLMELLRDEVTAFNAIGEDFLASILREISQNMARIEQKLGAKRANETSAQPFLVVRGDKNPDHLYISYWTTSSELANGLSVGTKLQAYSASAMNNSETLLITTTADGKPAPEETEYVSQLRKNIVTRGRLITAEDMRAFCLAELGSKVRKVEVKNHFVPGNLPGQGFVKCLQISLTTSRGGASQAEWARICDTLKAKIENLSTGMYPIQVVTA